MNTDKHGQNSTSGKCNRMEQQGWTQKGSSFTRT